MARLIIVVCSIHLSLVYGSELRFPAWFKFGAATAAYQVEGAWNDTDKGISVWDKFLHDNPGIIKDGSNPDIACDSFHRWKDDIKCAQEMGLDFYRFSISWPRLMPTGLTNHISESGVKYYNDLINGLLESGIEPMVTIYHWDLPQKLQDLGGWTNPLIEEWFADYAKLVFSLYADRVKVWLTINEPILMCHGVYVMEFGAPSLTETEIAPYLCTKNVLLAHARAWRIYDELYRPLYHGKVSIVNQLVWMEASSVENEEMAELARELCTGLYSHPIYSKRGGWPPSIEKRIANYSRKQGYARSRLPILTKEEIKYIRGTYDFYSLNYYTSRLAREMRPEDKPGTWFDSGAPELNLILEKDPKWPMMDLLLMPVFAPGIRRQIAWIRRQYGDIEIIVTENGAASFDETLEDDGRILYINDHLEQILLAIQEDGANVTGYTVWSLIDSFEWRSGFSLNFGLYAVDKKNLHRSPRKSARYYASVIKDRHLKPSLVTQHQRSSIKPNEASRSRYGFVVLSIAIVLVFI